MPRSYKPKHHWENDTFNTFFETSHSLTAEHLSKMYDFDYHLADTIENLKLELENFYAIKTPAILEIFTPTKNNDKVLLNYFKNLV